MKLIFHINKKGDYTSGGDWSIGRVKWENGARGGKAAAGRAGIGAARAPRAAAALAPGGQQRAAPGVKPGRFPRAADRADRAC